MTIENIKVFGIMDALRGMRNPLNSWAKNDTVTTCDPTDGHILTCEIGPNDTKLCTTLTNGGQPHRKFLRQINVTMDITAPTYWWAEMDTYKIATTRNSCSVQHKGASRDFIIGDFTFDNFMELEDKNISSSIYVSIKETLNTMNILRDKYNETKDYKYFRLMRQIMPMGYNYKTTWSGNYETLLNIYEWRRYHKLEEWHVLCKEIEKMPGMNVFLSGYQK